MQLREIPILRSNTFRCTEPVSTCLSFASYLFKAYKLLYKGTYMSAHVLLNLLNELRKNDKMQG